MHINFNHSNRLNAAVIPAGSLSPMVTLPTYDNLISDVSDALAQHFQRWIAEHDGDEIYAYVIYATPLVSNIAISVLTEQGLQRVASDYRTKHGYEETLEQLRMDLRWSVADTPYCGDYQELFASVNERLNAMMPYVDSLDVDDPAFTTHTDKLYSILVAALNHFRNHTLSGTTRPMLYVDFGDMSNEERLAFIEQCNEQELVEWYNSSIEMQG
ncbi:MAG: hypothetical protein Aurels2KO_53210 [Aureliella sp.]